MILYVEHTVDANDLPTALWRFCNNLDPKRDSHISKQPTHNHNPITNGQTSNYTACIGFDVIRLMTGRSIEYVFPPRSVTPPPPDAPPLLSVDQLSRRGEFEDVTFDVRPGEIVGLAGLVGAGRSEIIETIFGARRATADRSQVAGRPHCATDRCGQRSRRVSGCARKNASRRA